jgi:hypothetical protein
MRARRPTEQIGYLCLPIAGSHGEFAMLELAETGDVAET